MLTGVLLGGTSLGAVAAGEAGAQALDRSEQKCVNASNKGLARTAKVQRRENATCVKSGATGRLASTIEACLTADTRGRVAKARAGNTKRVSKACTTTPSFAVADASGAVASQVASDSEIELIHAIFGLARDCDALDDQLDNGSCGICTPGQEESCHTGPPGTLDVGVCRAGTRTCTPLGEWGSCSGQVLPSSELCNGLDDDCL